MSQTTETSRGDLTLNPEQTMSAPVYTPAVDIYETEDALLILADMPGVEKENISIHLDENILTLEGEATAPAEGEAFLLREYGVGNWRRQFTLSEVFDRSPIEASYTNGELTLVLPKSQAAKPHTIPVKGE